MSRRSLAAAAMADLWITPGHESDNSSKYFDKLGGRKDRGQPVESLGAAALLPRFHVKIR
jgi:hypothetical protein